MINKESIFASAGTTTGSSAAGFTTGMIPGTVAKAEDVNLYMGMSDQQLYSVCKEVANLLTDSGIVLNSNSYTQLITWAKEKLNSASYLTGIDATSYTTAPTQSGNAISFPEIKVVYNTDVYYGKTASSHQVTTLSAQTLAATSGWGDGVHFIYAKTTAGSSTSTLDHSQDPIAASEGATKCLLGSVFVINGAFQANSWKFQPWLQITSAERRESPTAMTRGGFISPASSTTLQMGDLEVLDEGIGFDANINTPSITNISGKTPYDYKFLYPGYNPAQSALTTLDTTHIYNTTDLTWDDISAMASDATPHFIVMVPCVVPTGQTLMIPAMSTKVGTSYPQVFDSIDDAVNHIYGLEYSLANVAKRAIYLGQSIVVKVGATDITDPTQFLTVGMLPQALSDFTTASGQTGGAISTYRPMPQINWTGSSSFIAQNNAANMIIGGATDVTITLPTPQSNIVNQLEIYFNKGGAGDIIWNTTILWYTGGAPTFTQGGTYNIILEYINGSWYGGVLGVGV
jgi:hypothetical protein